MNKKIIFLLIIIAIIGLGLLLISKIDQKAKETMTSHEMAELVGFNFINDFVAIAPPNSDPKAMERIYDVLSLSARNLVDQENLVYDMALFVGVQDVPDQGIVVEDFQIINDTTATLIVGLNYSGARITRNINLIVENGEWKIDSVTAYAEEIPEAAIILLSFVAEKEGVNLNEIELIDVLDQEWPDGCLGLAGPDEFCTQAIVPGYEIEIIVSGEWQVFRTNMDASVIRQAE